MLIIAIKDAIKSKHSQNVCLSVSTSNIECPSTPNAKRAQEKIHKNIYTKSQQDVNKLRIKLPFSARLLLIYIFCLVGWLLVVVVLVLGKDPFVIYYSNNKPFKLN